MPMIGFRRNIYFEWLEEAATLVCLGEDDAGLRARLGPVVAHTVTSDVNRRQTLDILANIWLGTGVSHPRLHAMALQLFQQTTAQADHVILHYGLTLLAYPFFREGARIIGQSLRFGGEVTTATLQEQMPAVVGGLGAVHDACKRITFSLRDWGILVDGTRRYQYVGREPRLTPSSTELACWLLAAALSAHPAESLPFEDLVHLHELFPFDIALTVRAAMGCDLLQVHRSGGGWDMVTLAAGAEMGRR